MHPNFDQMALLIDQPTRTFIHRKNRSVWKQLAEVWQWKYLLFTLVAGSVKNEKRNTVLGTFWHLLNPIVQMLIFMFVFAYIFKGRQPNYPLFFLSGMIFFRFIANSAAQGADIFYRDASLLQACAFPRLVAVFSCVFKNFYYFLMESAVVLILMVIYGIAPKLQFFYLLPFTIFLILGVSGFAMITACFGTWFPDLSNLMMHVNRMLFYFVPIMYPLNYISEKYQNIYLMNPIAATVEHGRNLILGNPVSSGLLAYLGLLFTGLFFAGLFVFSKMERRICKVI